MPSTVDTVVVLAMMTPVRMNSTVLATKVSISQVMQGVFRLAGEKSATEGADGHAQHDNREHPRRLRLELRDEKTDNTQKASPRFAQCGRPRRRRGRATRGIPRRTRTPTATAPKGTQMKKRNISSGVLSTPLAISFRSEKTTMAVPSLTRDSPSMMCPSRLLAPTSLSRATTGDGVRGAEDGPEHEGRPSPTRRGGSP